jgi:hypothetical protein
MSLARIAAGKASLARSLSVARNPVTGNNTSSTHSIQQQTLFVPPSRTMATATQRQPKIDRRKIYHSHLDQDFVTKRNVYRQELNEFRELLTLTNQQTRQGSEQLVDIKGAMALYERLREIGLFSSADIALLIQGVHSSARTNFKTSASVISDDRFRLMQRQSEVLLEFIEYIVADLKSGKCKTNAFGFTQLLTCYFTMRNPQRGYEVWTELAFDDSMNKNVKLLAFSPKVVGAAIDLMVADAKPIEDIENVYNECRKFGSSINLEHALARAYIYYDRVTEALKLFSNMVREYQNEEYYLARVHDTFVGDCANIDVAKSFFMEAVEKRTPYVVNVHPSAAHRLMERLWVANKNLDEVFEVWKLYLLSIPPGTRERTYNILTYALLTCFFEANPTMSPAAYGYLKSIIQTYSEIHSNVSALFLNTLLTLASQWKNADVTLGIVETYDVYNIKKHHDTFRVILNSLAAIPVSQEFITETWKARLSITEKERLEPYDFCALAKACSQPDRHALFGELFWEVFKNHGVSKAHLRNLHSYSGKNEGVAFIAPVIEQAKRELEQQELTSA